MNWIAIRGNVALKSKSPPEASVIASTDAGINKVFIYI
jgi:hypothetical protein